jgi:hypothetical protein
MTLIYVADVFANVYANVYAALCKTANDVTYLT